MDDLNGIEHAPAASVIRLQRVALGLDEDASRLRVLAGRQLGLRDESIDHVSIVRRSIDARNKRDLQFIYAVDVHLTGPSAIPPGVLGASLVLPEEPVELSPGSQPIEGRAVVVGCGPCGLFAALTLAENGYRPLLIERGRPVDARTADVKELFEASKLNPESNVLFGEGGAGTFSDGKLYTRVRSGNISKVLSTLVQCGAPDDITWESWPHIGSDVLPGVIARLRQRLIELGCEFRFEAKLDGLDAPAGQLRAMSVNGEPVETNAAILAVGHSARDVFAMLHGCGVRLEPKGFQMGVRAELPQALVDRAVYGRHPRHPKLPPAHFQLTARGTQKIRAAFTFCMCPGGVIVPATNAPDLLCTNGMSYRAQDGPMANCAVVVPVDAEDYPPGPLGGVDWQRHWEQAGFDLGGGDFVAPAQRATDFLAGRQSDSRLESSYPRGVTAADLSRCLYGPVAQAVARALKKFDERVPGFASDKSLLLAPESRCSSPVRIVRDKQTMQSVSTAGIYPAGEGAGHAGGIVSSALDGIRAARALITRFARPKL